MANTKQAKKRARQAEVSRQHNASRRSNLRTFIKKIRTAISSNDLESARTALNQATPVIDRMATRGLIAKNSAARFKSRINSRIKALISK